MPHITKVGTTTTILESNSFQITSNCPPRLPGCCQPRHQPHDQPYLTHHHRRLNPPTPATMVFRERAKALFKTKSRGSSVSKPSSTTTTSTSGTSPDGRWPSNVYKPGEPMPRPKYRAIPKKEHKEKLEAFNFGDAWRKKSFQSTYSPGGTRASSRRQSFMSFGKKSAASRSASVASNYGEEGPPGKSGVRQREGGHGVAVATRLSTEAENEDGDDDVGNGEF